MTIEELTKKFESMQTEVSVMKKDYELKLDSAQKDAESWKKTAEAKQAEAKKFQEEAEKAKKEKEKAYSEARAKDVQVFLETAKSEGKITPAMQEIAVKLAESMTSEDEIATFGEKDGKKISHTQLSLFKEFVSSLPKIDKTKSLTHGQMIRKETPKSGTGQEEVQTMEAFVNGVKQTVILDDTALHFKAIELQEEYSKKGQRLDYAEALIQAEKLIRQAA